MHVGEISFCDRTAYNIKCDDVKAGILARLSSQFGISVLHKHHHIFSPHAHVPTLNASPHLVSLRTNGNPYYLLLTRHDGINLCIFVDKKIQHGYFQPRMIISKLWFDDDLFGGDTLMDGEMIKTKAGTWLLLLNDLIADRGVHLLRTNLVKRIERLHQILKHSYTHDVVVPFSLQTKRYVEYQGVEELLASVPSLPYTCRGLYFKPLHLKFKDILFNFDDTLVVKHVRTKFKDAGHFLTSVQDITHRSPPVATSQQHQSDTHSSSNDKALSTSSRSSGRSSSDSSDCGDPDECLLPTAATATPSSPPRVFWVRKTALPDVYELWESPSSNGGGQPMRACVNRLETSQMLAQAFRHRNLLDRVPFHCTYSDKFGKWTPVATLEAVP